MSENEMREAFEAWFIEFKPNAILKRFQDGDYVSATTENYFAIWQHQQAKIDATKSECAKLLAEQDAKYNQQTNELIKRHAEQLDKARQPVSDFQLVSLLRVLTNCELPMEETRLRINSILERK